MNRFKNGWLSESIGEIARRVTIRGRINEEWRKVEETVMTIIRRKEVKTITAGILKKEEKNRQGMKIRRKRNIKYFLRISDILFHSRIVSITNNR